MVTRNSLPPVIATGFPSVDAALKGGISCGALLALGGDAGSGKSAFALGVALRAAERGHQVFILSCEMNPDRLRDRLRTIARGTTSPVHGEMQGHSGDRAGRVAAATESGFERYSAALPLHMRSFSPGSPPAHLADAVLDTPSGALVIVDHLQGAGGGIRPLAEDLATAVARLKGAALERDIAVLAVIHLEPASLGGARRPSLGDFGAMGAVQQHADQVLALFREEMYEAAPQVSGAAELHVLKNRHGALGYVDLYYHKEVLRFEDMDDPGDPLPAAFGAEP